MMLEGLKVVEWSTWVAAPGCAAILGEWGAEVVKVESAAGDPVRHIHPETPETPANPIFAMENRNKRGVVLNVASPEGRAAMLAMLARADVFVTNVRPGALKRAGLDFETLQELLPRLVYAQVTGYGRTGPEADVPAFDITGFWTRSGVAAATIPPDQEPYPCRPGFGDHVTALATLSGVLAALIERGRTGQGRLVETSLVRAGAYAISWDLSQQLCFGEVVTNQPRAERPSPLSNFFRTKDGRWFCLVPRGVGDWPAVARAIGRPELAEDPRFADAPSRKAHSAVLLPILDAGFGALTLEEAGARLTAGDVIWAPLQGPADLAADPMAREAGCFVETQDRFGGRYAAPASPVRFPGLPTATHRPSPAHGEHTREVLAEAGLTPAEIDQLFQAGAAA